MSKRAKKPSRPAHQTKSRPIRAATGSRAGRLSRKTLLTFEKKLLEEKQRILKRRDSHRDILFQHAKDNSGEISSFRTHIADQSSETFQREFTSQLTSQESKTLTEIDEALRRIQEKRYGVCERCGLKISLARLEAIPHTQLCIKCAQAKESITA